MTPYAAALLKMTPAEVTKHWQDIQRQKRDAGEHYYDTLIAINGDRTETVVATIDGLAS